MLAVGCCQNSRPCRRQSANANRVYYSPAVHEKSDADTLAVILRAKLAHPSA